MQRKTSVSDVRHVSSGKAGGPVGAALGQVVLMVLALSLALGVAGCGANVGDLLYQAGAATMNTYFDMALTDFVDCMAGALASEEADEGDGDGDGDEDGDEDEDEDEDGDGGETEAPDGAEIFAARCAACHGADGTGGAVFPDDITGTGAADLTTALDLGIHGSIALTAEEIEAVAEFLGG